MKNYWKISIYCRHSNSKEEKTMN